MGGVGDTGRSKTTRPQGDTRPSAADARVRGAEGARHGQSKRGAPGRPREREARGSGARGRGSARADWPRWRGCAGGRVVIGKPAAVWGGTCGRRAQPPPPRSATTSAWGDIGGRGKRGGQWQPESTPRCHRGGGRSPSPARVASSRRAVAPRPPRRCGGGYVVAVQPPPPRSAKKSAWGDIGGRGKRGGQWQPESTPRCHRGGGRSPSPARVASSRRAVAPPAAATAAARGGTRSRRAAAAAAVSQKKRTG